MVKRIPAAICAFALPLCLGAAPDAALGQKIDRAIEKGRACLLDTLPKDRRKKAAQEGEERAARARELLKPLQERLGRERDPKSKRARELQGEILRLWQETRADNFRDRAIPLAVYALIVSGSSRKDPEVQKLLKEVADQVRKGEDRTYDLALCILALGMDPARRDEEKYPKRGRLDYRSELQEAVDRLVKGQTEAGGWTYNCNGADKGGDLSNTQFAVLGLGLAEQLKLNVPEQTWRDLQKGLLSWHTAYAPSPAGRDGSGKNKKFAGWGYLLHSGQQTLSGSMTCAGICSMVLAKSALGKIPLEKIRAKSIQQIPPALAYLAEVDLPGVFADKPSGAVNYYHLYSLERAGALCRTETIGKHDWYGEGARLLLDKQAEDGSWSGSLGRTVDTSFALLFLSRATARTYTHYTVGGERGQPEVGEEIRPEEEDADPPPPEHVAPLPIPSAGR